MESIVHRLVGRGHGVWWDRRLRGGDDFGSIIQGALAASRCAVVAWSKFAQHSLWVRAEANSARECGKLVQLTLDGTKPPLPFSMLHTLDFEKDDGSPDAPPMLELAESVQAMVSGAASPPGTGRRTLTSGLAGFAPAAVVGGASIALVILAAALAGMGPRLLTADAFGLATGALFLVSVLGFAHMLVRVILTFVGSRQR